MKQIWAVRGGTTVTVDDPGEIIAATREMLVELMDRNQMEPEDLVSLLFTVTPDITSEFPAVAARELGLTSTPLMCAQEIAKPGALPLCIRVLVHFYTELTKEQLKPVYLREAVKLRPDLTRK